MHSVWNNIASEEVETAIKIFCVNNTKMLIGLNCGVCQTEDASLETCERFNASTCTH